jgi:hypothetical protein
MNRLNENHYLDDSGPFEARYLAFLETIATLRPSLHRYCARMTGSVMDGEDVVQEALFRRFLVHSSRSRSSSLSLSVHLRFSLVRPFVPPSCLRPSFRSRSGMA